MKKITTSTILKSLKCNGANQFKIECDDDKCKIIGDNLFKAIIEYDSLTLKTKPTNVYTYSNDNRNIRIDSNNNIIITSGNVAFNNTGTSIFGYKSATNSITDFVHKFNHFTIFEVYDLMKNTHKTNLNDEDDKDDENNEYYKEFQIEKKLLCFDSVSVNSAGCLKISNENSNVININASKLKFKSSGASKLILNFPDGDISTLKLNCSGASKLSFTSSILNIDKLYVDSSGASAVDVNIPNGKVDFSILEANGCSIIDGKLVTSETKMEANGCSKIKYVKVLNKGTFESNGVSSICVKCNPNASIKIDKSIDSKVEIDRHN